MSFSRLLPPALRMGLRRAQRTCRDLCSGHLFRRASPGDPHTVFPFRLTLDQAIRESPTRIQKISNLRQAAITIEALQLNPGEHLSFWAAVGAPTSARGYLPGRTLVGGALVEQPGGGLCQLAGLIYHLGLISGLEILERHAHSQDIYTEEERFTPLGADATVVFGYKDLRLANPHPDPVRFRFKLSENMIQGALECPEPIQSHLVTFERQPKASEIQVITQVDGKAIPRGASRYSR